MLNDYFLSLGNSSVPPLSSISINPGSEQHPFSDYENSLFSFYSFSISLCFNSVVCTNDDFFHYPGRQREV